MRIYLDTCSLHRPFDDQSQDRIARETDAIYSLLAECDAGSVSFASSDALLAEVGASADSERRRFAYEVLATATPVVAIDDTIRQRGREIEEFGVKALEAIHLACAEATSVDYFCTCDDRLLKKGKSIPGFGFKVVSPLDLIQEIIP